MPLGSLYSNGNSQTINIIKVRDLSVKKQNKEELRQSESTGVGERASLVKKLSEEESAEEANCTDI